MLYFALAALSAASANAACCGQNSWDLGCTACPANWYNNCGGHQEVGHGGCGFLSAGCYLQCIDNCPQQDYGCGCGAGTGCLDCAGIPNGGTVIDECGVCGGDNSSCTDCAGVVNGSSTPDVCGVCDGDTTTCQDCTGVPNGNAQVDECGVCEGDNTSCADCAGTPNGTLVVDDCGECGGSNTSCTYMSMGDSYCVGNGQSGLKRKKFDAMGVEECKQHCTDNADGKHCWGYKPVPNGKCWIYYDVVTEKKSGSLGDAEQFWCFRKKDCNNSFGTGAMPDECGVCEGDNTSCLDACGVLNGDGSTCTDCAGVAGGSAKLDACGVCNGDGSGCNITTWEQFENWCSASTANCRKCKGRDAVKNGNAFCKINRKKASKCSKFKKDPDTCARLNGCTYSEKTRSSGKIKPKCAGKAQLA